ncbi:Hypothetical predicted protein [Mytilus galloprovincialis]|uniref:Uncharacterized protein n=1 Tax=Mytilus galloprovincialis TaxID=29158 RepID=A0A8B6CEF2_MYTGA|nr:Hypothetical predicted protein [Mytilus galloprovincialis]
MERECRQQKATQLDKKLRRLQLKEERMTSKGAFRQNVIPHITQIAAVEHDTGSQFSCYVVPKAPMSSGAEDITGIMWDGIRT